MNHEDMQRTIVTYLAANGAWHRAVSLDIEASLSTLDNSALPVISISVSHRVDGKVKTLNFILEDETPEGEAKLIVQLGTFCREVRPLVVIGYNINHFDQPILALKMRQFDRMFQKSNQYSPDYWAFRETMGRSYFLDAVDPVRFEISKVDNLPPRMVSLEGATSHKRFSHLPMIRSKGVLSTAQTANGITDKWDAIYYLYKNDRQNFEKYISGDSHDTLLLAEELFGVKAFRVA